MEKKDTFEIGYFSKTKGLKGELQLYFTFSNYEDLNFDVLFVEQESKLVPFFLSEIKVQSNSTAYLKLEDLDHIDKVQGLLKKRVFMPLNLLPKRNPDEFYYEDLVGFEVTDLKLGKLGTITEVREYPQQHIATLIYKEKEIMFPLSDDLIDELDLTAKTLVVDLPEGLLEIYLN